MSISCRRDRLLLSLTHAVNLATPVCPIYFSLTQNGEAVNTLSRFDYVAGNEGSTLGSEEVLLQSSPRSTSIHAGGWVGFKPSDEGKDVGKHDIYWSAGDSGPQTDPEQHGQNVNDLHSTIARISVPSTGTGYTIPGGNVGKGKLFCLCLFFVVPYTVSQRRTFFFFGRCPSYILCV